MLTFHEYMVSHRGCARLLDGCTLRHVATKQRQLVHIYLALALCNHGCKHQHCMPQSDIFAIMLATKIDSGHQLQLVLIQDPIARRNSTIMNLDENWNIVVGWLDRTR